MTLYDYTLLVAKLGACFMTKNDHIARGYNCVRGICFEAKDQLALSLLYEALSKEEYDQLVKRIAEILFEEAKRTLKMPSYREHNAIIDYCFSSSYLFRALSETVKIG